MNKYVIAATLMLCFTSCNPPDDTQADQINNGFAGNSAFTSVKTVKVLLKKFDYSIQTTGKISAHYNQIISALTDGKVINCNAANNRVFSSGAPIVILDTKSILSKLKKSKEDLFNAEINYKSNLLSQESLLKNKTQGIKDTVLRKLSIDAGISTAEYEVNQLNFDLQNSIIKAPFDGKTANVKVQNNMYIKAGQELFTIYSCNELYIESQVLESEIASIHLDLQAVITPLSTDKLYTAKVAEINPIIDNTGMALIKLKLSKCDGLMPGMNCSIYIKLPSSQCLIVPKEAIVMRSGKAVVFTNVNGSAKWNYVTTGKDNGKEIEIKEGLNEGDEAIITNNIQLSQNSIIKINKL